MPPTSHRFPSSAGSPPVWRYALALIIGWTLVVVASFGWNTWRERQSVISLARMEALAHFQKDVAYRHWAAALGGVYAPVTEQTPPNPYLAEHPQRDVTTAAGQQLTLINPAYMTRLVHELAEREYDVLGHITSRNPIRPANAPDAWESDALKRIETHDLDEVAEVQSLDGQAHLRLMRPLPMQAACMKCHAQQGYQVGDIRGGISAAIPMKPFFATAQGKQMNLAGSHFMIWLLGLLGIGWGSKRVVRFQRQSQAAEREIRTHRERLDTTLHAIGDAVISTDDAGCVVDMNRVAERLTGWPLTQATGHPFQQVFRIVDAASRQPQPDPVATVLGTGETIELANHTKLLARDGTEYHIGDSAAPIHDQDGRITGVVVVFRDVTEQYEQRYRLRESEKRFRGFVEGTADILFSVSVDGVFDYVSPSWTRIMGHDIQAVIGSDFRPFVLADDIPLVEQFLQHILETGEPQLSNHYRVIHQDGHCLWLSTSGAPVRDEAGNVVNIVGIARDVTKWKKAEEQLLCTRDALAQSERRFRDVAMVTAEWIWEIDVQGRYTYCSPGVFDLLGYTPDELLGTTPFALMLPQEAERIQAWLTQAMTERKPLTKLENWNRSKNGEEVCLLTSCTPMLDDSGRLVGYRGVDMDITERKRAEVQLQAALDRQTAIYDASLVGIMVLENRIITTVNRRMAEMLGYSVDELVGEGPQKIHVSEANYDEFGEKYYWRLANHEVVGVEYPLRHKEGHIVWCRFNGRAIDPPDLAKGAVWIVDDLTDRRKTEQRQAAENRRIKSLLALNEMNDRPAHEITAFAIEEAIQLTGSEIGYFASVNEDESVMTMQHWSPTAHKQCRMTEQPIKYPVKGTGLWGEALRQRRPILTNDYSAPNPLKRGLPEGHVPITRHMNLPVFAGDRIVAIVGVGNKPADYDQHDVQQLQVLMNGAWQVIERKLNREELLCARDKLQQNVLALESSNRVLEEYNQRAEAATRAKSQFLANMSHEIRTPMTAILGFTDVLLGDENLTHVSEEAVDALRIIQRNGQHLLGLINDILDLSKIEAGKFETARTHSSPMEVVAEMASLMRVRAEAKNLPLQIEYDGPVPKTIHTDPLRLRQILINLVGNAIKFTETGHVRVVTRLISKDTQQPQIQFDVVDSGIGMSEDQVAKLFQPFSQVDSSMTRRFGGTGLGLTISKRLAEILGGDISVHSQPGQGSTFRVTLAAGSLDNVAMLNNLSEAAGHEPSGHQSSNTAATDVQLEGNILLAEDGPDNQRLIAFLLRKAGAKVTIAENGQIAHDLAIAAREAGAPFGLILMDMQMPVMDGYTATTKLRQAAYSGPIVALTAHAMEGAERECRDAGCDDYAKKPIDRPRFLALVARHLQHAQESSAAGLT